MAETKTEGATRAGNGSFLFDMNQVGKVDAGTGYSTAHGPLVEGDRMQCGVMKMPRGTGARPHTHPNEQWVYILQGQARASVAGQPETTVGPGALIYIPANVEHYVVSLGEEDTVFFTCKDMSHGIIGKAVDGTMSGPAYQPGFAPK